MSLAAKTRFDLAKGSLQLASKAKEPDSVQMIRKS